MQSPSPWPVIGVTVLCSGMAAFYAGAQLQPAPLLSLGITVLPFLTCAWWVRHDGRLHRVAFVQDWGLLAWVGWPVLVPWYAWSTRGRSGWRLALGLYTALVLPYIAAGIGLLFALARAD